MLQQTPLMTSAETSTPLAPPVSEAVVKESSTPLVKKEEASSSGAAIKETSAPLVKESDVSLTKATTKEDSAPLAKNEEASSSEAAIKETSTTPMKESEVSSSKAATKEEITPLVENEEASSTEAAIKETSAPLVKEREVSSPKATTKEEITPLVKNEEASSSEAAIKETSTPLMKESEVSSSKAATKEAITPLVKNEEASSSEAAIKETSAPLMKESEVSSTKEATKEEITPLVKNEKASSSEAAIKQPSTPLIKESEASSSKAVPEETSTPTTSSNAASKATAQTPQTHLTTPPPVHLNPSPTHLAPPLIRTNTTTPGVSAQPRQSQLSDPMVQNFIRNTRATTQTQTPTSIMQLGTVGTHRAAGNTDIESGVPDTRTRLDQTRSRMAALTAPVRGAIAATPGTLRATPAAIKSVLTLIAQNSFGPEEPWKGWSANWVNTMTHELLATGGTTITRELLSLLTEWAIKATSLSPERQGFAVGTIFVATAGANLIAMVHKKYQGSAIPTTHRGHMLQITALLGSMALAGVVGRGGENGQFGVLSTLLPSAIKSIAYLARDVINLVLPLDGNHDALYTRPVQGQATDVSYLGTEEAVNAGQDAVGLSGVGLLDAVGSGGTSLHDAVGKLFSYATLNAAGEGIANVSLRVANELSVHGFGSPEALKAIKDLRLSYGKYDSEKGSFAAQFGDKMAGAGIARLSLFLSLYAVTGTIAYAFGGTSLGKAVQNHLEEVIGAALIIAGCLPFAMSTSSAPAEQEPATASITEIPADDTAPTPTVVADPSGNLSPDTTQQPLGGLRPASAAGSVSSTGRRSFEVV